MLTILLLRYRDLDPDLADPGLNQFLILTRSSFTGEVPNEIGKKFIVRNEVIESNREVEILMQGMISIFLWGCNMI